MYNDKSTVVIKNKRKYSKLSLDTKPQFFIVLNGLNIHMHLKDHMFFVCTLHTVQYTWKIARSVHTLCILLAIVSCPISYERFWPFIRCLVIDYCSSLASSFTKNTKFYKTEGSFPEVATVIRKISFIIHNY